MDINADFNKSRRFLASRQERRARHVEGTYYYLRKKVPGNSIDVINISEIPPLSSIHVVGDLYYTPDCEMTIYGTKDVTCIDVTDAIKQHETINAD